MNERNDYIRRWLGVRAWHEKGYTGSRGLTLSAEKASTEHGAKTLEAFHEIAPDREVRRQAFYETKSQAGQFCREAEKTGADTMYMSISTTGKITGSEILDENMPEYLSFFAAAGNYGSAAFNALTIPETIYSVGACTLKYSKSLNGKPLPSAQLLLQIADYTSPSEYVDFAGISGLYLKDGSFEGTSCSAPVLCGMAAIVNDFFIDKTGKALTSKAMYQFFVDNCFEIEGEGDFTGFGIPRLPSPDRVDIWKYQKGERIVTVKELIAAAMAQVGTKEYPAKSNNVKYNTAYYGREVNGSNFSWCLVFIWWLFRSLGASEMFYDGKKTASCTTFYKWYEAKGMTVNKDYRPGDIVFYDWDKSGDCDHVGLLVEINGDKCRVVEGNTAVGNDSNGGEVMLRDRTVSQFKGAVRLSFEEEEEMTGKEIIAALSDEQAYQLITKAQAYAATLTPPDWAKEELKEAVEAGITDGERPMELIPRYQAALMAKRSKK